MEEKTLTTVGYKQPFTYAVLLHIVIIAALFMQFSFTRPTDDLGLHLGENIIEATVVSQSVLDAAEKKHIAQKQAEEQRIAEQQRAEAQKLADEKAAEQKRIADAKAAEQKRVAEKAAAEKAKVLAAEKKKADALAAEQARKLAATRAAEQAAREKALEQELANEAQSAAAQRVIASEVDRYTLLIKQRVTQNWLVQAGFEGLSCQLDIRLASSGTVLEARVVQSSGDAAFDRSAILAVQKASPLPVPSNPQAFAVFRNLRLTLRPEM